MNLPTQVIEYKVEVYSWQLKGIPKTVHKQVLPKLSDIADGKLPKEILHVGVAVYNRLYHYNQTGIQVNFEVPIKYKRCGSIQYTKKSQGELENWLSEQRGKYSYLDYNIGTNNCISFAQDVCSFLEVPFEGPQKFLDTWLQANPQFVRKLDEVVLSNRILRFFGLVPKKVKQRTYVDSSGSFEEDDDNDPYNFVTIEYGNNNYESDDDEAEFALIE